MYITEYNATAKEIRTTFGNKEEMHLTLVESCDVGVDNSVVWNDKYIEVHNLDGKYIMKLKPCDVVYLGKLCDSIIKCLN
jgi:hypothetical protein